MPHPLRHWFVGLALIAAGAGTQSLLAQENPPRLPGQVSPSAPKSSDSQAPADKQKEEKLAYFRERLEPLRIANAASPDKPLRFVPEPLNTFENPVSQMWDGYAFVWTDRGRPAAALKCYYHSLNKRWGRTFVSLATEQIELASGDKKLWTPQEAGVSFSPLPSGPPVAADARRRLAQMRDIARRFEMVDQWGLKDPTDWRLRLLPAPLYRYEAPDKSVVDGTMFGYVVNSPEALVLIEARKSEEGLAWHYAVARFTRFAVKVLLDGQLVADFPRLEAWPPTGVYFHDPVELPDYPFERPQQPEAPKK
jgi:hypothetical protein